MEAKQETGTKHTPGPWAFDGGERKGGPNVLPRWALYREMFPDTTGKVGAGIVSYSRSTFAYVNAEEDDMHLIAAAPDLFEALQEIAKGEGAFSLDPLVHAGNVIDRAKELARDALAKVGAQ